MNTEKERVLAYSLAKEISNEELSQVSGGGARMSQYGSFKPTGSTGQVDGYVDFTLDW